MDDEAEVGSSSDEEQMESEESRAAHKKKRALISSDEDEDDDEDEEKAREEMKGFIASEEEGDGDDSDGDVRRKKRKKQSRSRSRSRSDEENDIDDEDRELLKENLGVDFAKKRKRIRMESGSDSSGESDGENKEQDKIPDFEGEPVDSDDADDFIVGADGQPLRGERKKKKTHFFDDHNLQMAEDIFGVDCDFGVFAEDDDEEDIEDYEEEDEEEGGQEQRRRKPKRGKRIFEMYEPSELEARHFTDKDQNIRETDIPERMQLRNPPVTAPHGNVDEVNEELLREAEWIFNKFTKHQISKQENSGSTLTDREIESWLRNKHLITDKIKDALSEMRVNFYDGEYCKLQSRKKALRTLFEQCQKYQQETICANLDAEIPKDVRLVKEDDLDKIDSITTVE